MSPVPSDTVMMVDGRAVPVLLVRNARSRGFRLRYDARSDALRLTMPVRGSTRAAMKWALAQEPWVRDQMARAPAPLILADGVTFPCEGRATRIMWRPGAPRMPHLDGDVLQVGGECARVGARLLLWLKGRARHVLSAESHDMAHGAQLPIRSVAVGDPRGRWGSCSSAGALRYSWRLILAPPDVRRAIVAHEVAHLRHMDHSPAFHALHAALLGEDPAPSRDWLARHGAQLHRIGIS